MADGTLAHPADSGSCDAGSPMSGAMPAEIVGSVAGWRRRRNDLAVGWVGLSDSRCYGEKAIGVRQGGLMSYEVPSWPM
jgi:hypothetical protein